MSAVSLRPIPCRRPLSTIEDVLHGGLAGLSLGLAFNPTPRGLLGSTFFAAFGVYNYLVIRCSLLCMSSGESILRPREASPAAGFFAGSATAFMVRPGLAPPQVLAVTAGSTLIAWMQGLAEEEQLIEENSNI